MTLIPNPESIELDDIQGLVVRGYGQLPLSHIFFVKIGSAKIIRKLLRTIIPRITPATKYHSEMSMNVAFTFEGLKAIGLSDKNARNFPIPFRMGMTDPICQRKLGDWGESAPDKWLWGGIGQDEIHIMLALYASTEGQMKHFREEIKSEIEVLESQREDGELHDETTAIKIVYEIGGYRRPDAKEQFGFHDSISQPVIKGSGRKGTAENIVATGEFVLGYLNEHNQYPYTPLITDAQGDLNLLPSDAKGSGEKDFGRNGTFIAFRQFQQYVDKFWEYMSQHTLKDNGDEDKLAQIKLASKMIGRWPGGAPLVKYPDEEPENDSSDNDFNYAKEDPYGYKCPLGSHMRRNNPRDTFRDQGIKQSVKVTKRHRIIRRGRLYDSSEKGNKEKGLLFMGINADLEQQFEFIQHIWSNNLQPNKKSLYNDPDPIIGVPDKEDPNCAFGKNYRFAKQKEPVTEYVDQLERFIRIRGGGYFFLPGLSALRYITTLDE